MRSGEPATAPSLGTQSGSIPVPLVRLEGVGRIFDNGLVVALKDINLSIYPGERVAVVGQSGSGKSSLISIMGGCDAPTSGRVYWKGSHIRNFSAWTPLRGVEIGIVFQDFLLLPTLTAVENVEMALMGRGMTSRKRRERAAALIGEVGLSARSGHLPHALSGGERQRVAIARSIANRPALLLADEPTGNLDSVNAATVLDLLLDIQRRYGTSLVLVTHDEGLAARCERNIRMKDGCIDSGGGGSERHEPNAATSPGAIGGRSGSPR